MSSQEQQLSELSRLMSDIGDKIKNIEEQEKEISEKEFVEISDLRKKIEEKVGIGNGTTGKN